MPKLLTAEMQQFRQELMVDFLAEMIVYAKNKGAKNAITLLPVGEDARESLPWDRVLNLSTDWQRPGHSGRE